MGTINIKFVCQEEKLRQEAIKKAEEERRIKHKKMEEERENLRQNIRDKVSQSYKNQNDTKKKWDWVNPINIQKLHGELN